MSKILQFGVGPLPAYAGDYIPGLAISTWFLTRPLLQDGHEVLLISFESPGPTRPTDGSNPLAREFPRFRIHPMDPVGPNNLSETIRKSRDLLRDFRPDAVVTVGSPICSPVAVEMPLDIPMWADLRGGLMPEVQAKGVVCDAPELYRLIYRDYFRLLRRGDYFSAVSEPQRKMVIGELGIVGRLNRENFGTDLVSVLRNAIDPDEKLEHKETVARGIICAEDDFIILWSGAYNTWADVETLFKGVDKAMAECPKVHYVSTGGGIAWHDESRYKAFLKLIEGSKYREHYHLLGWLPFEKVPNFYFEADVGINVDLPIYEAEFGARTRFLPWSQAGLPIITTITTEISHIFSDNGLALCVPTSDPDSLAAAILKAEGNREENRQRGAKLHDFAVKNWLMKKVAEPLLKWARNPKPAPDRASGKRDPLDLLLDRFEEILYAPFPEPRKSWKDRLRILYKG